MTARQFIRHNTALAVAAALFVIALASVILAAGPSYIMAPWDVFIILDEAWRILCGQIPHTDFHNPIGPLSYSLTALGMKAGGLSLAGYVYGNVLFLLVASLWGGAVFFSRLRPIYAFILTLFVALLSAATRPLGYNPFITSYAMTYNRYGWVLLLIAYIQLFIEPQNKSPNKDRIDAISIGLLLGALFYCKINFFGIAIVGLAFAAILRHPIRNNLLVCLSSFLVVYIGVWLAFDVNPADYMKDVLAAGQAQSLEHRLRRLATALAYNYWQIPLAGVVGYLLAVPRGRPDNAIWPSALRMSAVYFFILGSALILTASNAVERSDIPFFFVAGLILLHQAERTWGLNPFAEIKDRNWRYIAPLAIILIFFFSHIALKDMWSIANTLIGSAPVTTAENKEQRFDSERLSDFLIPASSEWGTAYWQANEVPSAINDGLQLLRRNIGKNDRIIVLALTDPFSFALGLRPLPNIPVWWDLNFSFNRSSHPAYEQLFRESTFVVYPILRAEDKGCCQETVEVMLEIYGGPLKKDFAEIGRSDHWVLLKRTRS